MRRLTDDVVPAEAPRRERAAEGEASPEPARISVVICGHVDHGKSTIIGRLLADTQSLPEERLERIRDLCERTARPFEYAFLLDALKDEQAQGITIDAARVFFKTAGRSYDLIDAPGHIEFLKNMVTGASRAEAALLVIDAREGVQENTRRHGYMLALLGIRQVAVLVNKMDLVDWDQVLFDRLATEYASFLRCVGIEPLCAIPVSGRGGQNVVRRGPLTAWYQGPTVLAVLEAFRPERPLGGAAFRMPVQDVYKFTQRGDDRRIVAGTVATGTLTVGDEVMFYPSGKRARVRSLEAFNRPPSTSVQAGMAIGFTLDEQIYVTRGEVAARVGEAQPAVASRLRVSLFWLGRKPMVRGKEYTLKCGTARVSVELEAVQRLIDASDLAADGDTRQIERHAVAECTLVLDRPIAVDVEHVSRATSRFVIVEDYDIGGGGIVREAVPDRQSRRRATTWSGPVRWEPSPIEAACRAEKYSQEATLVVVTGARDAERKAIAERVEAGLFADGRFVYCLGITDEESGGSAAGERSGHHRHEHLQRLAEIARVMLDAGAVLIVTARDLTHGDLELLRAGVECERVTTVWVGDGATTDIAYDVFLDHAAGVAEGAARVNAFLREHGPVFPAR